MIGLVSRAASSLKISNLVLGAFIMSRFDWSRSCGCVCARVPVCVLVCMPQTLGGLTVQARACPGCQKWEMMAGQSQEANGDIQPWYLWKQMPTQLSRRGRDIRYIHSFWLFFFVVVLAKIGALIASLPGDKEKKRATSKQKGLGILSGGRATSNCYWRRWLTVNTLESLR